MSKSSFTTSEMIIPEVPKGNVIFDLGNKPGYIIVGPRSRFELEDENGYAPYEISWERAVQMLNDKNDPANLHYHSEPTLVDTDEESYEIDYEDDDDELPKRGARFNRGYAKKKREKNRDEQRRTARLIKERMALGENR